MRSQAIFSAIDHSDGDAKSRRAYGIEIVKTGTLMAVSFDKAAMENYLVTCGQATSPEHWRIIELGLSR